MVHFLHHRIQAWELLQGFGSHRSLIPCADLPYSFTLQYIDITAPDDGLILGDFITTLTLTTSSIGSGYNGLEEKITVKINQQRSPGIAVRVEVALQPLSNIMGFTLLDCYAEKPRATHEEPLLSPGANCLQVEPKTVTLKSILNRGAGLISVRLTEEPGAVVTVKLQVCNPFVFCLPSCCQVSMSYRLHYMRTPCAGSIQFRHFLP